VPAAVTALTAQQLREQQVESAADLQRVVSNTTMTDQNSIIAGTLTAFIRGIGTDPGFQQGIGIYIDDMYLQSPLGTDIGVYGNIDRIEVLKGPQGNLYGRNTIGGAIKYVTRDPDDEPQGSIEVRGGEFNLQQTTADLSGPLGHGDLYGDIGVFWKTRDGIQTNLYNGQKLGSIDQRAVHAVVKWAPGDGFSLKLGGTYSLDISHPRAPAFIGTLPAAAPFNALPQMALIYDLLSANLPVPQLAGLQSLIRPIAAANTPGLNTPPVFPTLGPDQADTNLDYGQYLTEASSGFLAGQWIIDDQWTAKSSTTYRTVRIKNNLDLDGLPEAYINTFQRFANADVSQEFQVNFSSQRAAAVAGLYYLNGHDGIPDTDTVSPLVQLTQYTTEVQSESEQKVKSIAAYGNLDYNLTDTWHASVGARYTSEDVGIVLRDTAVNTSLPLLSVVGQNIAFPLVNSPLASFEAQAIAAASGGTLAFVPGSTSTTVTDVSPTYDVQELHPDREVRPRLRSANPGLRGLFRGLQGRRLRHIPAFHPVRPGEGPQLHRWIEDHYRGREAALEHGSLLQRLHQQTTLDRGPRRWHPRQGDQKCRPGAYVWRGHGHRLAHAYRAATPRVDGRLPGNGCRALLSDE
jgi:iron complex outermembrane receptor protein